MTKTEETIYRYIKENFKMFRPNKDANTVIPQKAGNYIFLLEKDIPLHTRSIKNLPVIKTIELQGEEYQIIYTGIAKDDLKQRILGKHFNGNNAGRSTLRLSLGCLMGMIKIPRDKVVNSHYKFREANEVLLTKWMRENLLVLFMVNDDFDEVENHMIATLNPPLNLDKNSNVENMAFRAELKKLRSKEMNFEVIYE